MADNEICTGHDEHLCHLSGERMHENDPEGYAGLVHDPQFVCKNCGRVAAGEKNLCNPVELGRWDTAS